jgi:hypothetical protein
VRAGDVRQTGMFSYRVGICNQCRLNGRILRFYGEAGPLSVLVSEHRKW